MPSAIRNSEGFDILLSNSESRSASFIRRPLLHALISLFITGFRDLQAFRKYEKSRLHFRFLNLKVQIICSKTG